MLAALSAGDVGGRVGGGGAAELGSTVCVVVTELWEGSSRHWLPADALGEVGELSRRSEAAQSITEQLVRSGSGKLGWHISSIKITSA